jgi:hypothetical protein
MTSRENTPLLALLAIHDRWSERLWDVVDSRPGHLDEYVAQLLALSAT